MEKQSGGSLNRRLVRALLIIALACFLMLLLPPLGAGAIIFIPLMVMYCYAKNGRARGLFAVAMSVALAFGFLVLLDAYAALPLIAALALTGVIVAECLHRNYSIEKTILNAVTALFLLEGAFISYRAFVANDTPWHLLQTYLAGQLKSSLAVYAGWPVAAEQIDLIKKNLPEIAAALTMIFPALSLVAMMFMVWTNLLVGRTLLRKCALPSPDFGDLSKWKAPEKLVWYLIGAGVMLLLSNKETEIVAWNMLVVISAVYLFAGLAIVSFFLKKSPFPAGFRYLIYLLIFAQQIFTMLVAAAGLFDLWVDFRKLNKTTVDTVV